MNNATNKPIGTSLPLERQVKRRPIAPWTPEQIAIMENPPLVHGMTREEWLDVIRAMSALNTACAQDLDRA